MPLLCVKGIFLYLQKKVVKSNLPEATYVRAENLKVKAVKSQSKSELSGPLILSVWSHSVTQGLQRLQLNC